MNGSSKPTVLIHGFGFDHRIWYPVELAFEGRYVIYLSLPGFGTDDGISTYTIAELANKYWRHLNEIVQAPVHLVGHSMGGYVCMEMIAQQPARVSSLSLVHSHVFEDSPEKKKIRSETMKEIGEKGKDDFVRKLISSLFGNGQFTYDEIIEQLIARGLQYSNDAWCLGVQAMRDRNDHTETLKNISVPVLMLMGEADKAVPPDLAHKQAQLTNKAKLHLYPQVGHMAMYEQPSRVIQDLIGFYDSLPS